MNNIFYIGLFLFLYGGANVLSYFGWNSFSENSPIWQRLLPSAYLMIFLFLYRFILNVKVVGFYNSTKYEIKIFVLLFFLFIFLKFSEQSDFLSMFMNALFLPVLFSFLLSSLNNSPSKKSVIKKIKKIIIYFFIVNSLIAIIERILHSNFFPLNGLDYLSKGAHYFRSTALQNHPLSNALVTSIIMSFILISEFKLFYKKILILLGYIAILCFNTRSTVFGWIIFLLIYVGYELLFVKNVKTITKIGYILFSILSGAIVYQLMVNYGFGDRLINMGLYDNDSAGVRIQIWNVFRHYSFKEFLWGMSESRMTMIVRSIGVLSIENFLLYYMFRFGVVFTILIIFFYTLLINNLLRGYNKFSKLFVVFVFLSISSTNNSLSSPISIALALFLICSHIFNKKEDRQIIGY